MAVRVRPDVWKLQPWDAVLVWYARAVRKMQERPLDDPTSWRYQAAVHAYIRDRDPFALPGETLPSAANQVTFWNRCQHGNWYFLPWHRLYLGFFEQIVQAAILEAAQELNEDPPTQWTLPYWNYSDNTNANARRIPPAFRETRLPDGTPNPLRVDQRVRAANLGRIMATDTDVDIVDCVDEESFVGGFAGVPTGFGGTETGVSHTGGVPGKTEMTPHGDMHVAVGGRPPLPVGFMSRFHTAALDPLFWLHHANIDRLWNVWLKRRPSNTNPSDSEWLDEPDFDFHDASRTSVKGTCRQVADSETSPFEYRYDDESDPLPPAAPDVTEAEEEEPVIEQLPAEMVGATASPVTLDGRAVTARVPLQAPTGPAAESEGDPTSGRVLIRIENIKGPDPIPHLVYINVPEGGDPFAHRERLAGSLSMFGLPEASGEDPQHPGSGLTYSLDITDVVQRLGAEWSPNELRVTLVPKPIVGLDDADVAALEASESELPRIEVGQISVYRRR